MKKYQLDLSVFLNLFFVCTFLNACLKCPDDYVTPKSNNINYKSPDLFVTANANKTISLSWTYDLTNENQFKIERKKNTGDFIIIDSISIASNNYIDSNLIINCNYSYRIYACINSIKASEYSNEINVTAIP